jgi:hypothetical protein
MANNFQLILLPPASFIYIVDYVYETNVGVCIWCLMAIKLGLANFDEIIKRGQIKMSLCTACVCKQRGEGTHKIRGAAGKISSCPSPFALRQQYLHSDLCERSMIFYTIINKRRGKTKFSARLMEMLQRKMRGQLI